MTMRIEECLVCDAYFSPTPRHPMVESSWCPDCWRALRERFVIDWDADQPVPAMRVEAV
jgi:hypothetical protein